ncbi:MAG: molybdopterin molybdotransferase MoeA [Clostridium sp.]|nr:molybdopterin molybdotransferase MoeA [Acetatifactor muris]MCM1527347.1 molybdopterin molybdotransferase MoeA [Bacteroides sp.]MCM1563626.1 molybdopterin molybdotransferase MoeA [Clostridium sp.]
MARERKDDRPEIEECLAMLLEGVAEQPLQEIFIDDACGMALGETVCSDMDVPPYPKAAMDGYAVRAEDTAGASLENPVVLCVAGRLFAGDHEEIAAGANTAVRIMTGAFIPQGFDAVVRQEDTDYGEEEVKIYAPVRPFQNYCRQGEDIRRGETVVERGIRLGPVHIGLLAEIGKAKVKVRRPVRTAILCTGTELVEAGRPLTKGKIYNSISHILASAIEREGLVVVQSAICEDEEETLLKSLRDALDRADLVITTGGVSVGRKDIVPKTLEDLGAKILFRRAHIQPGTPTTAAVKDGRPILCLSGNPYAALVNFEIYFWPLMAKMMGCESFDTVKGSAILQSPYDKVNGMRRFVRAYAKDGKVFLPTQTHASSVVSNLTQCNCFMDIPAGGRVGVGDEVRIQYIRGM